jgi:hypothetical protein
MARVERVEMVVMQASKRKDVAPKIQHPVLVAGVAPEVTALPVTAVMVEMVELHQLHWNTPSVQYTMDMVAAEEQDYWGMG